VDIWEDLDTLRFLQYVEYLPQVTSNSLNSSRFLHSLFKACFYHWSCDLVGELPQTSKGNVYIMIMIEHFSKWVELVALPDKSSHNTSQAFLQ